MPKPQQLYRMTVEFPDTGRRIRSRVWTRGMHSAGRIALKEAFRKLPRNNFAHSAKRCVVVLEQIDESS